MNSQVGRMDTRGKLCPSCHHMRPVAAFTWQVGSKFYCSQLCAKRMEIPRPRTPDHEV